LTFLDNDKAREEINTDDEIISISSDDEELEKSYPDLMLINEHKINCRDNQFKSVEKNEMDLTEPEVEANETSINEKLLLRTSHLSFFTCLKPYCNLIFPYFPTFKLHHREHFEIGNELMCWQCCKSFPRLTCLRNHQFNGNCRTLGMFKCYECSEQYEDIQSLSIHKYITHNGNLQLQKKNKKTCKCPTCKIDININDLRNHLIQGQCNNTKMAPTPIFVKQKRWCTSKCKICGKVCHTAATLAIHSKVHKPGSSKIRNQHNELATDYQITYIKENLTISSQSQSNETPKRINYDQFPFVDGMYSCIKCPKKFNTKRGMGIHWNYCCKVKKNVFINNFTVVNNIKNHPNDLDKIVAK